MALTFHKVYPENYLMILPLLEKFETAGDLKEKFPLLFQIHWPCSIDFCGVMIQDQNKVIAYLGLIFSDRILQNKPVVCANLTTLIIDSEYRGQKLTHRLVQYLQSLGPFSLTAITPIPSLYSMYKANGFKDLEDHRIVFWKNPFSIKKSSGILLSDKDKIEPNLSEMSLRIFLDHQQFPCDILLFKKGESSAFVILKDIVGQRRKFFTNRFLGYFDWIVRKGFKLDLLSKTMVCKEIHYCDNYAFLMSELNDFLGLAFPSLDVSGICIRKEKFLLNPSYSIFQSEFFHSRQMVYSPTVPKELLDGLYSELFVMDM